ncbi:MAG: phospholipase C/P1 nuclease family protein [Planctomycetota bacterium]|jgi:hypothetical protein
MNRSAFPGKAAALLAAVMVAAGAVQVALAWGIAGHQIVAFRAVSLLPDELQGFFKANIESVIAFANEPDLLARGDPAESENHYFNLDAFGEPPFDNVPSDEMVFLRRFGEKAVGKGRLPWAVRDRYNALAEAFARRDLQSVIKEAGYLSHYVGDATMPLHSTLNYKGQFSGNVILDDDSVDRHVHVRFEIGMVDAHDEEIVAAIRRRALKPRRFTDPAANALELLVKSYPHIDRILTADRALLAPGGEVAPEYYEKMYEQVGEIAVNRLAKASEAVALFWLSAWRKGGEPKLFAAEVVLTTPPLEAAGQVHSDYLRPKDTAR